MNRRTDTPREPAFVQERIRKAALLTRAGQSAKEIAVRLDVSQRTVTRYRAALRRTRVTQK